MLDWKIELSDGQATIEPEEVYSTWPQLKMAVQMLGRLPEGGARKNFENQVEHLKTFKGVHFRSCCRC